MVQCSDWARQSHGIGWKIERWTIFSLLEMNIIEVFEAAIHFTEIKQNGNGLYWEIIFSGFIFLSFLLDIFFIYISNVIPFPSFPSKNPLSTPLSPCSPTYLFPFLILAFPYTGGIQPSFLYNCKLLPASKKNWLRKLPYLFTLSLYYYVMSFHVKRCWRTYWFFIIIH